MKAYNIERVFSEDANTYVKNPLKVCNHCGKKAHTLAELDEFTNDKYAPDGVMNWCWDCRREYLKNRISYKGKSEFVAENPRKGVCCMCGRVVPPDANQNPIHHDVYNDDDHLKDTRELCKECHDNYKRQLKREKEKAEMHDLSKIWS
jgi:hypothetical protein